MSNEAKKLGDSNMLARNATPNKDKQAPSGLDKQIFNAAEKGNKEELARLSGEWAGNAVINWQNPEKNELRISTHTHTHTYKPIHTSMNSHTQTHTHTQHTHTHTHVVLTNL